MLSFMSGRIVKFEALRLVENDEAKKIVQFAVDRNWCLVIGIITRRLCADTDCLSLTIQIMVGGFWLKNR